MSFRGLRVATALLLAGPAAASEPSVLSVVTAASAETAGGALALSPASETLVDPAARFRVTLSAASRDARLTLLDGADALVASSGTTEVDGGTTLTLAPAEPLRPGARYRLRIEGATGRALTASDGHSFAPATFALLAAGTAPAPEPKAKRRTRRR